MSKRKIMTTVTGIPVGDNQNSLTVGPRGPVLIEDYLLLELNSPTSFILRSEIHRPT